MTDCPLGGTHRTNGSGKALQIHDGIIRELEAELNRRDGLVPKDERCVECGRSNEGANDGLCRECGSAREREESNAR